MYRCVQQKQTLHSNINSKVCIGMFMLNLRFACACSHFADDDQNTRHCFSIDKNAGNISVTCLLDRETKDYYKIIIKVTTSQTIYNVVYRFYTGYNIDQISI